MGEQCEAPGVEGGDVEVRRTGDPGASVSAKTSRLANDDADEVSVGGEAGFGEGSGCDSEELLDPEDKPERVLELLDRVTRGTGAGGGE